ncbi:hypothetical protein D3C71_2080730 [compost metagenome]
MKSTLLSLLLGSASCRLPSGIALTAMVPVCAAFGLVSGGISTLMVKSAFCPGASVPLGMTSATRHTTS